MLPLRLTLLAVFSLALAACGGGIDRGEPKFALASYEPLPQTLPPLQDTLGINIHFTDALPGELDLLAASGVKWVRMDLFWQATEPIPGQYDFSAYNRLLTALQQRGIGAMLILDYANPIYDRGSMKSPQARAAFTRWAAFAASQYRNQRIIFELWNEPNITWPGGPNANDYADLAVQTARAIRRAAPNTPIFAPATSKIDDSFLETCFRAGLLNDLSGVTVHPYRDGPPETFSTDVARLRDLIARYSPQRQVPVIAGEWGYPGSDMRQAAYLVRMAVSNLASGVPMTIWYDWNDRPGTAKGREAGFQVVQDGPPIPPSQTPLVPKPSYYALRTLTTLFHDARITQRIPLGSDADYLVAFRRGNQPLYVAWTTRKDHTVGVRLSIAGLRPFGLGGQPLPPLLTNPDGTTLLPLTGEPIYLVP